jgi:SulP family sulfate permease
MARADAERECTVGFLRSFEPSFAATTPRRCERTLSLAWPRRLNARFPGSLLGIILATLIARVGHWPVRVIGAIPNALVLHDHLSLRAVPWAHLQDFLAPTLTIAGLGAVESLLCGAVASNMTGIGLAANQELIAQGAGNILLPFFGGVPATAAIARTSVGINSGGRTRLVSVIHALVILAAMFALGPILSGVPLAALAGVLIVTAWRMNEWESIHYIVRHRFKVAMLTFGVTMLATIALDLTQAILIGAILSAAIFVSEIAAIKITVEQVDPAKLREKGIVAESNCEHVRVAYITGPLFFAATGHFNEAFAHLPDTHALVLSMRGVPLIDTSGLQAMAALQRRLGAAGGKHFLAGVHEEVRAMLRRGRLEESIGTDNIFWSADQAIAAIEHRACPHCRGETTGLGAVPVRRRQDSLF